MKVTVCFDSVRIVVPCGAGELLVRDLITEATRRYKKASGKCPDSWVEVHHLQSQSGILDPDDRVADVADDREQILASYEVDRDRPTIGQGDGASGGSSVGTGSPDIFRGSSGKYSPSHIEVTGGRGDPSPGLQVRRGSEPTLIGQGTESRVPPTSPDRQDPTKRWSAAPICRDDEDESAVSGVSSTNGVRSGTPDRLLSNGGPGGYSGMPWLTPAEHSPENEINVGHFQRSGRLSMQFLGDGNGARWAEAAERASAYHALVGSKSLPRESRRKEPLGQANTTNGHHASDDNQHHEDDTYETTLVLGEAGAPLGLRAAPEGDGLLVHAVEPGGRAARGRVHPGDLVLSIDGTDLRKLPLRAIEEAFRAGVDAPELRLRVRRRRNPAWMHHGAMQNGGDKVLIEADERPIGAKVATVSPTRKMPGRPPSLLVSNTRKLGKRLELSLRKGPHGLGFSVTTRDNPAGGHCPVYIKNILPRGAAVEDGRLQPGDRLLEVNGETMTGRTQAEVVAVLRATPPGATVTIAVSRQENGGAANEREIGYDAPAEEEVNKVPDKILNTNSEDNLKPEKKLRESQREKSYSAASLPWKHREVMTFDIPVNDTEKAGLGVSVKGKTGSPGSASAGGDLGIFVKSVLHGGAASRDGRLKTNDQLLNVNGMSLQHQSNAEAMETLRRAMLHSGGRIPGSITLTVARKISHNHSSGSHGHNSSMSSHKLNISSAETERIGGNSTMDENEDVSEQSSDRLMDTQEANTVIYVPNRKPMEPVETWNNPVVDRLTGMGSSNNYNAGLRNESYYMATNNTWVSGGAHSRQGSLTVNLPTGEAVLIEDDTTDSISRPMNQNKQMYEQRDLNGSHHNDLVNSMNDTGDPQTPSDATYASQLSLNNGEEAFSRDAIGRRSMSEKHHAALDAKGTGTYQRNKKLREERERERMNGGKSAGSIESLSSIKHGNEDLALEAKDRVSDLGPSLGLKKSSSLESLQTMVQELQMGDGRTHPGLRPIRGRACGDSLRAVVEAPADAHPRKHWLTDDASDRAFPSRNDPILSSLNDGKSKNSRKKHRPGLLKGIGSMFRFGKHRKDGVADITPEANPNPAQNDRPPMPPRYQNPPPVVAGNMPPAEMGNMNRYSHYVNYEEIQNHLSRRQQLYHSTRSNRSEPHQRPVSSYYEYESVQWAKGNKPNNYQRSPTRQPSDIYQTSPNENGLYTKHAPQPYKKPQSAQNSSQGSNNYNLPGAASKQNVGLPRTRGPYITQVMIKEQTGSKV